MKMQLLLLLLLFISIVLVSSYPIFKNNYPTYNRFPTLSLNVSIATLLLVNENDFYFGSPVNDIFPNLPITNPKDAIYHVNNLLNALRGIEIANVRLVSSDMVFPSGLDVAPISIKNELNFIGDALIIGTGRFPLGGLGAAGELFLLDSITGEKVLISTEANEDEPWYYSKALFYDIDKDGDLDVLCIRNTETGRLIPPARFPFWGQLLWFEQPSSSPRGNWIEHILVNPEEVTNDGPDGGSMSFQDIDNDGIPELAVAEFWSYKTTLYYPENGDWSDAESIIRIDINPPNSIGNVYDVYFSDINNDNKLDLLVTNHINEAEPEPETPSTLFLYLIADDFKSNPNNAFTEIIIDNDLARYYKPDTLSPGYVTSFRPKGYESQKPMIALGGDGTGK
jgi:hypothetical protein